MEPTTNNTNPTTGLKDRLKGLNGPQRFLVAVAAVFAALILTGAIYQAFFKEEPTPTVPTPSAVPASAEVSITKNGFSPATITISPNTQLTWTNTDSRPHQPAADPHPLNNSIEGFEGDTVLQPGDSLAFTFEETGTYTLHDHLNPLNAKFRLTVVVE